MILRNIGLIGDNFQIDFTFKFLFDVVQRLIKSFQHIHHIHFLSLTSLSASGPAYPTLHAHFGRVAYTLSDSHVSNVYDISQKASSYSLAMTNCSMIFSFSSSLAFAASSSRRSIISAVDSWNQSLAYILIQFL